MKTPPSFPIVKIKGKYLHSPYNPIKEAKRVTDREDYSEKTLIILFEPGLGYAAEELLNRYGHVKLLIISPLNLLREDLRKKERISCWNGDLNEGLHHFLASHIHESDIGSLAYLPWPPAVRLLPDKASRVNEKISSFLKLLQANHAHLKGFSYANLKNSVINYLISPPPRLPLLTGKPVLVAASGPSLEESRKEIKKREKAYFIIALPSAVKALLDGGIRPHMILTTDPGYWASRHFRHFPDDIPVGMGLSARREYGTKSQVYPLIVQQTYTDKLFLHEWNLPHVSAAGSVALTALQFALAQKASSLTYVGLDLCMRDIKSHASPHSFDNFLISATNRFTSIHQIHYERASAMTSHKEGSLRYGHALEQYRYWLNGLNVTMPLFRLDGGTPPVEGLHEISSLKDFPPLTEEWYSPAIPSLSRRREKVMTLLNTWNIRAREHFKEPKLLLSPDNDGFNDFLYTLAPDEFSRLKMNLVLEREVINSLKTTEDNIMMVFHDMEALIERLSFHES